MFFGNSGPLFLGICPNRRPNGEASRTTTKCTLPFVLSTIDASECVLYTLRDWLPKIVQFSATRAPCRWVPKVDICRCHDRSTANKWSQTWFSGLLLPIKHRRVLWDHSFSRQGRQHDRNARSWATLDCLKNEFWTKSRYWTGCVLLSSIVHYWRSFPNSSYSARYRQKKQMNLVKCCYGNYSPLKFREILTNLYELKSCKVEKTTYATTINTANKNNDNRDEKKVVLSSIL